MEQRWKTLKKIHQKISADFTDLNLTESTNLCSMFKVLLSLEIKSCDLYPSRCLHCHQLLGLTVVKMLYENCNEEPWRRICLTFDGCFEDVLIKCIFNGDKFMSYSAQKAVLAILKSDIYLVERQLDLLRKIVERIEQKESRAVQIVLEILSQLMSRKNDQTLNEICFKIMQSKLPQVLQLAKCGSGSVLKLEIFTLVQKIVKFINGQPKREERMKTVLGDFLLDVIPVIFCDPNLDKMSIRKLLDIFNTMLSFSDYLILQKNLDDFFLQFCLKFYECLSKKEFYENVKTSNVGFTGCLVPTPQLDLPLLRRLILLTFTVFSLIIKHDQDLKLNAVVVCLENSIKSVGQLMSRSDDDISLQWLPLVLEDQDDAYIECLLCLLDLDISLYKRNPELRILKSIDPYPIFLQLLETTNYDHSVVIDWLVSPETCFLLYFFRFLKTVVGNWWQFVAAVHFKYGKDCNKVKMAFVKESESKSEKSCQMAPEEMSDNSVEVSAVHDGKTANGLKTDNVTIKFCEMETDSVMPNSVQNVAEACNKDCVVVSSNLKVEENDMTQEGKHLLGIQKISQSDKRLNSINAITKLSVQDDNIRQVTSGLAAIMSYSDDDDDDDDDDQNLDCDDNSLHIEESIENRQYSDDFKMCDESKKLESDDKNSLDRHINVNKSDVNTSISELACNSENYWTARPCDMLCLEHVMGMFIRVRMKIERLVDQDLFPYNPVPLLNLMIQCESLYEA
ncbi:hypothetical protein SNE40_012553 [Patella caerulea]|uniref:Uncharacterized protein n=1 Tax=Patella caerulea TaxID=87958 RepID=A0AAN8PQR3_PATCE